MKPTLP